MTSTRSPETGPAGTAQTRVAGNDRLRTPASPAPAAGAEVATWHWLPGMVVLGLIWGSSFLFIKVGISQLPPLYVTLGRVASGAVVLLGVMGASRQTFPRDLRVWGHSALVAVVNIAVPFTLFGYGEQRIPSLLAGIWNSTTPLVVLPLAVLVFRTERMTARRGLGLALGFLGALVILGVWRGVGGAGLAGQLMCLAAAACYGVGIAYTRRFVAPLPYSGVVMSACQLSVATVLLLMAGPLLTGGVPDLGNLHPRVVAAVLALGALGTGLAFVLNLRNIRLVGATTASMVTYIVPVFAVAIGALVLGESLAWYQPVGAAVVLLGVAVSQGLLSRRSLPGAPEEAPAIVPEQAATKAGDRQAH